MMTVCGVVRPPIGREVYSRDKCVYLIKVKYIIEEANNLKRKAALIDDAFAPMPRPALFR